MHWQVLILNLSYLNVDDVYGGFISTVLHGKIPFPEKGRSLFAGLLFTTQVQSSGVDLATRGVTIIF